MGHLNESWPRFQSLPDDGALWLLTWLGPFFTEPSMLSQRSILAAVTPLRGSVRRSPSSVTRGHYPRPDRLGSQRLVSFAVGDLPALTTGTLYRNGRPITRGKSLLKSADFGVDFDRQQVFRLNEVPAGQAAPVLSQAALLLSGAWPLMASTACVGLPLRDDPFGICVPVPEVLRWCYGSSSRMLQAVLSGDLEGALKDVTQTASIEDGQYDLTLPAGFVEQDALTLAWLTSDEATRARALTVDRSVMVNTGRSENRPDLSAPSAVFPYQGVHSLNTLGRWIAQGDAYPRFLVHRILGTSYRLPFTVTVPEPQHAPSGGDAPAPGWRNRPTPPADARRSTVVSTAEPRRQGNPARLPALPSQFSGVSILQRAVTAPSSPGSRPLGTATPTGPFSTGLGADATSRARRATLVHRGEPPGGESAVRTDEFQTLRRVLALLAAQGFTVRELAVNNPGGGESRFRDWTNPDGQRIACLIAQLERQGAFVYLLERQRTQREYGPLLIAWHADHRETSEAGLDALLTLRASGRTWPKTHADWVLIHVAHNFGTDETYAAGIKARLGPLPEPPPAPSAEAST